MGHGALKGALGLLGAARPAPGSSLSASGRGPPECQWPRPAGSCAAAAAAGTAAFKFDSESWSEFMLLPVPLSGRTAVTVTVAAANGPPAIMILSGRRAPP